MLRFQNVNEINYLIYDYFQKQVLRKFNLYLLKNSFIMAEAADPMVQVEESLECPVCYRIPRELPIPSCVAGHIVCQPCRSKVTECPTCRGKFNSNTSNLAAKLILVASHKCKFNFYGCEMKMKLEEIIQHEKVCPERTIYCPVCKEETQMKTFGKHAVEKKCADKPFECFSEDYTDDECVVYTSQYLDNFWWDGVKPLKDSVMMKPTDANWKMRHISYMHGFAFFLTFSFSASKHSFFISLMLPRDVETASKFTAKLSIKEEDNSGPPNLDPRSLTYVGPVLSIEDLPDINSDEAASKYWVVPFDVMKSFFTIKKYNRGDENPRNYQVRSSIWIEEVRKRKG